MQNYEFFEVLEIRQDGNHRVCVCGSEQDALMMVRLAKEGTKRTYERRRFLPTDTVDVTAVAGEPDLALEEGRVLSQGEGEAFSVL
ncbi:MAG: hypothetical protein EB168_08950 [Euryarchaeota archaeon]|nr:hypothetical protein [Euryarchaeota archaeon]